MDSSSQEGEKKKKITEVQTFQVPFPINENQGNHTINTKTPSKTSKEQIINQAFKFHSQGNISEAAKYYQEFINQGFKDHRVFSNYGGILQDIGKLKEAEILLRKAIEIKPNFEDAYYNLGNILKDLGESQDAELSYRKAIEIKPDFAEAHSNLGNILSDLGKSKDAELSYRKAIEIKPDFAEAHSNLGNILSDLRKSKDAELSYRKAIKINPNFAETHLHMGNIMRDIGKLKDAENSYYKAIKIKPDFEEAHSNLGIILRDLGKLQELILLSKSTLELRSINKGNKLLALVRLTIANLLQKDFSKTLLRLNETNDLINQGAINTIKDEKNKKYSLNFSRFITSLYPLLEKENKHPDSKKIPHIGESHCLSFAHQTMSLSSQVKTIQPVLITGGKAWHFATQQNNQWKNSLTEQIKNHHYSDEIFISFGEIDCRKDEGILNYAIRNDKNISEVCKETIKGYLDYMEEILSKNYSKRYYFGVAAPVRKQKSPNELDKKQIEIIKKYNSILKKQVLSKGSYFLDVYGLTSNKDGENNNLHMCDKTHLSPKCLSILFENYLHKS